ncbi:hypothetical protein [Amycolatopsis sp. Hca4]|uniref:hypothetical protein n=1 Tax=Amycolatopsis sp. Hca4 TaxID=2742131 RepID=UPI001590AC33|nr:hypothetical protein [Amycolatopsis sp. Hca4]QKV80624.1 hypothetical protein HUT10_47750 [Amycolatopsis sp. Hca4]
MPALMVVAAISLGVYYWADSYVGALDPASVRVDVLRLSLTTAAGTGGGLALWLAFHRQRSSEITGQHTIHDATKRRITELYTSATEQLGSDQPAVRLAELYALERLGRDSEHPTLRQTIIDVVCAYLRMPLREDAAATESGAAREAELEVRRAAQKLIIRHIHTVGKSNRENEDVLSEDFWPDLDLDLSGAQLDELDLVLCKCRSLTLDRATIAGKTALDGTEVREKVSCKRTMFCGWVIVDGLRTLMTSFESAIFEAGIGMSDSHPSGVLSFVGAEVRKRDTFQKCTFGCVTFSDCKHDGAGIRFKDCTVVADSVGLTALPNEWTVGAEVHPPPLSSHRENVCR